MSPDLREYVLSLPLDVRRELCRVPCDAVYSLASCSAEWGLLVMSPIMVRTYLNCLEVEDATIFAALPVSPIAIALHAAKLAGRLGSHWVNVSVAPCHNFETSTAGLEARSFGRNDKPDVREVYEDKSEDDLGQDPTGHRAAIELLRKVMAL